MKLKAQKQIIESILINLQAFLEKKDASQITSHILFHIKHNNTIIQSSDSEMGLQINTQNISILEEGSFTAHGKKLLDIIRILKDDEIVLEIIKNDLIISQKHSKFKLPTFDANTYPSFPSIQNKNKLSLDSLSLIQNLKKISPAIDTNNPKFELNGALINIKENSTDLVGTDTRRLAIATIIKSNTENISIIIPKKAIIEIQKLFLDQIDIYYDENYLIISNQSYFFYTKLINGKFPNYERIIPSSTKHEVILPKKEMLEAIKMITSISQEIKITLQPHKILFDSLSADKVEAKTALDIDTQLTENFEIAFNSKYMLDFISRSNKNTFILAFNEPQLPFIVKDDNFITIIMPIVA
jgi:DNA polymerase-3 subunit beta